MKKALSGLLVLLSLALMAATIDLDNLFNYSGLTHPAYVTKDNTPATNPLTNKGATLGRVLFYDKSLSVNNTLSCGSCHKQQFAFGDTAGLSAGHNGGVTGRHSMRLVNARFGTEAKFFWDERAASLEAQTTGPIKDHIEMGFSGIGGHPDIDSLIRRLEAKPYYQQLFTFVYGSPQITEQKMQLALAQFVRSIQSFDSRYDIGRAQVANDGQPFPNFTAQENAGKAIFLNPPNAGGAGCQGCHRAPEFDIDPASLNNGVTAVAGSATQSDLTNTRSPSLRDLVNPSGQLNGPLMHTGGFTSLAQVVGHYNQVPNNPANTNLDPRLRGPGGQPQNLQLTPMQQNALAAFLLTLTGTQVYTASQWSDPFDSQGNISILPLLNAGSEQADTKLQVYPNPATDNITIQVEPGRYTLLITDMRGAELATRMLTGTQSISVGHLPAGVYVVQVQNQTTGKAVTQRFVKQ